MKVVCKINNLNSFSDKRLLERLTKYISMPDGDVDLEVGKEYMVYGEYFGIIALGIICALKSTMNIQYHLLLNFLM